MAVAIGLRLPNMGRAYWVDEGISVGIASHPLAKIPGLLRQDGSPPLFYLLLHGWMRLFGSSEIGTHSLALVLSVAIVPVAWWSGHTLFGRSAGLAAVALTATNPFLGWYSSETRMYSLVCLLAIVALTLTVLAVRQRRLGYAAGAVVAFAALLYTHNWGLYLFATTVGILVVTAVWWQQDRALLRASLISAAAVGVLYIPWVPTLLAQVQSTAAPWAVSPNLGDLFADPSSALGGTLGILIAPLLAFGVWITRGRRRFVDTEVATMLTAVGVGTLLIGWLVSQVDPSWTTRYLAVAVGPLLMAVAGALASNRRGVQVIAACCALLASWSVVGSLIHNPNGRYAKSNVAAIAEAVGPELAPGDVVVVTQTEQLAVLAHYLPPGMVYVTPTGPVADPKVVDWQNIVHRLTVANPCEAVGASLAALPPGAHVLEISPLVPVGASGSTWSRASHRQVDLIDQLVTADRGLVAVQRYTEATVPKPFSAVVGELFVRVPGPSPCS